jgi:hypothetical protein
METNLDSLNTNNTTAQLERPDFLKIICILSFVASGLMILIFSLGSITLAMSESTIEEIWPQVIQSNPQFEDVDGLEFFHSVGLYCVYALIANIFSLIGVIMMWRLEKMGFFIYVVAELVTNFFSLNINTGNASPSYLGLVFSILFDLVFIVMYFVNLKHMNKNQSIQ